MWQTPDSVYYMYTFINSYTYSNYLALNSNLCPNLIYAYVKHGIITCFLEASKTGGFPTKVFVYVMYSTCFMVIFNLMSYFARNCNCSAWGSRKLAGSASVKQVYKLKLIHADRNRKSCIYIPGLFYHIFVCFISFTFSLIYSIVNVHVNLFFVILFLMPIYLDQFRFLMKYWQFYGITVLVG